MSEQQQATKPQAQHVPGRRSVELFERAGSSLVGGVNSPVRAYRSVGMTPPFIERGKGSRIWDVDGNEFIDYVGSWGPLILGHADERVLEAVRGALERGIHFGAPHELEVELAEKVRDFVPSLERVRFVNSGGEATAGALRAARGFTGRDKVIKFEGCYHGSVDSLLVKAGSGATTLGIADSAGVPAAMAETTLVAEFNNLQSVNDLLDEYSGEVAAVILEPVPGNMGVVAPELPFLQGLRDICDREGMVLIYDEVMTGFRVAGGGAQALFEQMPDLTVFGKVVGGGLPVGAYGGREDIMAQIAPQGPVYQAGTLSGNPVAMAAGLATLEVLEDEAVYADLSLKAQALMDGLMAVCSEHGVPLETTFYGGMMGFFFAEAPVRNYQDAIACNKGVFTRFFRGMLQHGVYLAPSPFEAAFMSAAHSDEDVERTLAAARRVMQHL